MADSPANARTFNGTSDYIRFTGSLLTSLTNPSTYVALVNKATDGINHVPLRIANSAGNTVYGGIQINTSNVLRNFGASGTASSSFTVLSSEGWVLIVTSKASGTATPRFHKMPVSSGVWTHSNGDIAVSNVGSPGSGGVAHIGRNDGSSWMNGDVAAAAVYSRALTDAETEQLALSYRQWLRLAPAAMWVLDQASTATTVPDLSGNGSNQLSITGTSVSSSPPVTPLYGAAGLGAMGAG